MTEIEVSEHYAAPVDRVFGVVSDHETFLSGGRVRCTLLEVGPHERNGLGAVRRIDGPGVAFVEDIIAFEAPSHFAYRIRQLRGPLGVPLPIEHERGWLEFSEEHDGTRVTWRSRFRVTVPWGAERIAVRLKGQFEAQFSRFLRRARSAIESS